MTIYSSWTQICICPNCGCHLHYRPYYHNIYSGGPWCCGNCHYDVTEAIYGKKPEKTETR
jgi:hypothetical protein